MVKKNSILRLSLKEWKAKSMTTYVRNQEASYIPGLISVIMPCFNGEKYLEAAIGSVLDQSYPNVELIVVDDGSTDGSKKIAQSFGSKVFFIEQSHLGPGPARNKGFLFSRGEFVAFLDADDYWRHDCLEKLHAALSESNAVLSYCGWQNIGLKVKKGAPFIPPDYELENKVEMFLRAAAPWPIHAALVRRNVLEAVGGFDVQWPTCMDYDLWLRIATSRPIKRVEEVLAFYRHHSESQITSKQWRQARNVWLIKKNFVKQFPELVADFPRQKLRQLIDGGLLRRGYDAYWRRDLVSAHKIFRMVLLTYYWRLKDIYYLLPAMLPESWYIKLIKKADYRTVKQ